MKIRAGQWVRLDNRIMQCESVEINNNIEFYSFYGGKRTMSQTYLDAYHDRISIKHTPQELVQEHDVIEYTAGEDVILDKIRRIIDDYIYMQQGYTEYKGIVKIFTLDSNGNYIKQWERES